MTLSLSTEALFFVALVLLARGGWRSLVAWLALVFGVVVWLLRRVECVVVGVVRLRAGRRRALSP
jgi:hypothetical protein